jgi:hypothetical protein
MSGARSLRLAAAVAPALLFAQPALSEEDHSTYQSLWDGVAKDPDCKQQDDVDLTIVNCDTSHTQWYFTKPGHPAHPGVVRREVVGNNGEVGIHMSGWSFASDDDQPAFKTFLAQLEALNAEVKEYMAEQNGQPRPPPIAVGGNWQPPDPDNRAVVSLSTYYVGLEYSGHTESSYDLLDPGLRSMLPYSQYAANAQNLLASSGAVKNFVVKDIDWEKDPAAGPPGTFAAADFIAQTEKGQLCGYLAWRKANDGFFTLVREETNILDASMSEETRTKFKAQFHCAS